MFELFKNAGGPAEAQTVETPLTFQNQWVKSVSNVQSSKMTQMSKKGGPHRVHLKPQALRVLE